MRQLPLCLVALLSPGLFGQAEPAPHSSEPKTILEVTHIVHGMSTSQILYVSLKSDGHAEWERFADRGKIERQSLVIPLDDLASIVERLNAIDVARLPPRMGPYNSYTDTAAELEIEILASGATQKLAIWNPWPCTLPSCSLGKKKPMPAAVKCLFCEISKLRSRVANEPLTAMCTAPAMPK